MTTRATANKAKQAAELQRCLEESHHGHKKARNSQEELQLVTGSLETTEDSLKQCQEALRELDVRTTEEITEKKKAGSSWRQGNKAVLRSFNRPNLDIFSEDAGEHRAALQVVFKVQSPSHEESEEQAEKRDRVEKLIWQRATGSVSNSAQKPKRKKLKEDDIREQLWWNDDDDDEEEETSTTRFTTELLDVRDRGETSMRMAKALLDMCRSGCAPFNNLRLSIAPWLASAKDKNSQLLKKTFQEKVEEAIAEEEANAQRKKKRLKT